MSRSDLMHKLGAVESKLHKIAALLQDDVLLHILFQNSSVSVTAAAINCIDYVLITIH